MPGQGCVRPAGCSPLTMSASMPCGARVTLDDVVDRGVERSLPLDDGVSAMLLARMPR